MLRKAFDLGVSEVDLAGGAARASYTPDAGLQCRMDITIGRYGAILAVALRYDTGPASWPGPA